jgi:hypothetical protein
MLLPTRMAMALAFASFAFGGETLILVGTAINFTNPDAPKAAPVKFVSEPNGTCTLTVSLPLYGSGACSIEKFDQKSGHIEIVSKGEADITWSGEVKGNFIEGTYQLEQQSGAFTLAIVTEDSVTKSNAPATTPSRPQVRAAQAASGSCAPAVETSISGDFHGWDGDTLFKLDNGQIWQQAEYDYTYSYSYRPRVTIYQTSAGCRLKVEDERETIVVKRIK